MFDAAARTIAVWPAVKSHINAKILDNISFIGASPGGQYRRALADSARAAAAARADLAAERSLAFTGYGELYTRPNPATHAEAVRLAARLGVPLPPGSEGTAPTGKGYPWRFGMAGNRYLPGQLGGSRSRSPQSTSRTMAPYMRALDAARFSETGNSFPFGRLGGGASADSLIGHGGGLPALYPPIPREKPTRADPVDRLLAFPVESNRMAEGDAWGGREFEAWRDNRTRKHAGIDLDAAPGDPVTPAVNGIVTNVGLAYPQEEGQPAYRYVEVTTDDGRSHATFMSITRSRSVSAWRPANADWVGLGYQFMISRHVEPCSARHSMLSAKDLFIPATNSTTCSIRPRRFRGGTCRNGRPRLRRSCASGTAAHPHGIRCLRHGSRRRAPGRGLGATRHRDG